MKRRYSCWLSEHVNCRCEAGVHFLFNNIYVYMHSVVSRSLGGHKSMLGPLKQESTEGWYLPCGC